jgi:hypothetical protein
LPQESSLYLLSFWQTDSEISDADELRSSVKECRDDSQFVSAESVSGLSPQSLPSRGLCRVLTVHSPPTTVHGQGRSDDSQLCLRRVSLRIVSAESPVSGTLSVLTVHGLLGRRL